ncbi:MAG: hypothetical protein IJX16_02310 [Clostridia bacterium]|nr:hypothetical protein [Clostridia bacterium]
MKIPYVKRMNEKLKSFRAENLHQIIKKCTNGEFDNFRKFVKVGLQRADFKCPSEQVSLFEKVGNKLFYYTVSGKIYFSQGNTLTEVKDLILYNPPIVIEIIHNGKRKPLILSETGWGYVVEDDGTSSTYTVPIGEFACVYKHMLFVADGNILNFSAVGDYTDFTMDLNHGGMIKTDLSDGKIIALIEQDGKLVIFTNRAVYEFIATGERLDYTLERVGEFNFNNVLSKTVKNCCGKIIFIDGNQMLCYENKKITKIEDVSYLTEYSVQNFAGTNKNTYYFVANDSDNNYKILRYDISSKNHCVIDGKDNTLSVCDGGYVYSGNGLVFNMVSDVFPDTVVTFDSIDFDLGTAREKVLHVISFFSLEDGEMVIQSENGSRKFAIKKGANLIRVNIPTKIFKLIFSGKANFTVSQIKIEYRIKEK